MSGENFEEISYISVKFNDKNEFYISSCNEKFKEFAESKKISLEQIVLSDVFKESFKNMLPRTESLILKCSKDSCKYFVTTIPISENRKFDKMIILISEIPVMENKPDFEKLTDREKEVFMLAADGLSNKNIACRLEIKEGTVKKILNSCYKKLKINSRIDAVKLFYSGL